MKFVEYIEGTKHASSNPDISDSHEAFNDCGAYIDKDVVVIDIDHLDKSTIQELIKYFGIKTQMVWTDRGVHMFFKKPEGHKKAFNGICALGFEIEQKTSKNSPNGITIKRNGVLRTIENEGTYAPLPNFFDLRSKFVNLVGLEEGDNRNSALFSLKGKLKNCDGWFDIMRFVNLHIFATPLEEKEFEQVARESDVVGKSNSPYDIATYIINEYQCRNYNNDIWWVRDGHYIKDLENQYLQRLVWNMNIFKKSREVEEVIKQVKSRSPIIESDTEFNIRFKNGVLMQDGYFAEIEYREFTPYYIDINYYEDAKPIKMVDDYIEHLTNGEKEYRDLLLESFGFALVTRRETIRTFGRFFFLRGEGGNGKGTALQIMQKIFNPQNCSNMDIDELCDPRNNVSMLDKLVNLGDDIKAETIDNKKMKMLKNISTCDTVNTRRLYHEGKSVTFIAKMFFTTNSGVKSYEKGKSYQRRVVWMPMFTEVKKPDPLFITKITTPEALEYWVSLIVKGYFRLLKQGWTKSPIVEEYNDEYHKSNNIYIQFFEDFDFDKHIQGKTLQDVKKMFEDWNEDDLKWNSKLFNETMWQKFHAGFAKKRLSDGTLKRIITLQSETNQDLKPKS